ncbi:DNA utilization family protein [Erwinia sorbitola]|uniref:DUF2531 family protein n=1 Tax=Erwinia sorbitola TaxID=2681984 RepID=A0A6I6EN21_9GAMM|nr:DNA utilization family protein [Erwinia sorbitola]QGU85992.1 DUF2531 family protein [Erwinia sorbitola]
MKIKLAWGVLLLAFHSWARDPFFPLNTLRCQPEEEAEFSWRLLGIIGREDRYDAWLVSPQGNTLWRQQGDPLPGSPWRVAGIEQEAVTLTILQECQPPRRLALKGQHNDQDDLPVAGSDNPIISESGSPLTGF